MNGETESPREWVVLGEAPNQTVAELWRNRLLGAGVPAMLRAGDVSSFLGVSPNPCRVLVPEDRVEEAREVLGNGDQ